MTTIALRIRDRADLLRVIEAALRREGRLDARGAPAALLLLPKDIPLRG